MPMPISNSLPAQYSAVGPPPTMANDPSTMGVSLNKAGQPSANPQGINRGPYPTDRFLNPYGSQPGSQAYGRTAIYGGQGDLMKSVATRDIAIQNLVSNLGRQDVPSGLMSALQAGGSQLGGQLGGEEAQNIQPGIQRAFTTYGDQYKNQLAGMLNNAYVLGGGLYGSSLGAWASAKAQDEARRLRNTQSVQAILQGVSSGLGGGGSSIGGGGGGGGGGGDAGIGNIIIGAYGAANG